MELISPFNLNEINTYLATEREADKCGKGEMVSKIGAHSTRRQHTLTTSAAFSLAPRLAAFTCATLPSSDGVTLLQDVTRPPVHFVHRGGSADHAKPTEKESFWTLGPTG